MKWYLRAAEGGDAEAQYELGGRYDVGLGVPRDMTESAKWLLKAAAQGHTIAMFNLALYYEEGKGVPRDLTAAVGYFREASDLGHAKSMCCLGDMYRLGAGTPQSDQDAYRWYFTAMTAGYRNCEERLKNAKKLLEKARREAAEREAKEWLGALQVRMSAPRPPTGR